MGSGFSDRDAHLRVGSRFLCKKLFRGWHGRLLRSTGRIVKRDHQMQPQVADTLEFCPGQSDAITQNDPAQFNSAGARWPYAGRSYRRAG